MKRKRSVSPSPSSSTTPARIKSPFKRVKEAKTEVQAESEKDVLDRSGPSEETSRAARGGKTEKMDTWEDDGIEYVDAPSPSKVSCLGVFFCGLYDGY